MRELTHENIFLGFCWSADTDDYTANWGGWHWDECSSGRYIKGIYSLRDVSSMGHRHIQGTKNSRISVTDSMTLHQLPSKICLGRWRSPEQEGVHLCAAEQAEARAGETQGHRRLTAHHIHIHLCQGASRSQMNKGHPPANLYSDLEASRWQKVTGHLPRPNLYIHTFQPRVTQQQISIVTLPCSNRWISRSHIIRGHPAANLYGDLMATLSCIYRWISRAHIIRDHPAANLYSDLALQQGDKSLTHYQWSVVSQQLISMEILPGS
jgi:hypothetical protein